MGTIAKQDRGNEDNEDLFQVWGARWMCRGRKLGYLADSRGKDDGGPPTRELSPTEPPGPLNGAICRLFCPPALLAAIARWAKAPKSGWVLVSSE